MRAIVLVDAAPGFEESIETAIRRTDGVQRVVRCKRKNFDLAVRLEVEGPLALERFLHSDLYGISGVMGFHARRSTPRPRVRPRSTPKQATPTIAV